MSLGLESFTNSQTSFKKCRRPFTQGQILKEINKRYFGNNEELKSKPRLFYESHCDQNEKIMARNTMNIKKKSRTIGQLVPLKRKEME